jgi:hypothetical protein
MNPSQESNQALYDGILANGNACQEPWDGVYPEQQVASSSSITLDQLTGPTMPVYPSTPAVGDTMQPSSSSLAMALARTPSSNTNLAISGPRGKGGTKGKGRSKKMSEQELAEVRLVNEIYAQFAELEKTEPDTETPTRSGHKTPEWSPEWSPPAPSSFKFAVELPKSSTQWISQAGPSSLTPVETTFNAVDPFDPIQSPFDSSSIAIAGPSIPSTAPTLPNAGGFTSSQTPMPSSENDWPAWLDPQLR